jgi:hypothetical protein
MDNCNKIKQRPDNAQDSGSKDIETLLKSKFVKITSEGINENHPHNVTITREAPNYSRES